MSAAVIFSSPAVPGEMFDSFALMAEFECGSVVCGWKTGEPLCGWRLSCLHLTNTPPDELLRYHAPDVKIVSRGWPGAVA